MENNYRNGKQEKKKKHKEMARAPIRSLCNLWIGWWIYDPRVAMDDKEE